MHPASGRNPELILPSADTDRMNAALSEFARWADPGGGKVLVLMVDNAGRHLSGALEVPTDVVLHRLPSGTPELQPVEPLWPLVREAVANKGFDELEAMQRPLVERCRYLIDHPELVRGAAGFYWAAALNG